MGLTKNRAKKILNISRSHLTRLISIITEFNYLSYIQFKANPTINPLCRLCGEDNETFWHFITDCPRLQTNRNDTFLDDLPQQDNCNMMKKNYHENGQYGNNLQGLGYQELVLVKS